MSDLSVFVDESGDVGPNSDRHLVALAFHDQSRPIDGALAKLGARLANLGFPLDAAIHTGPAIRRKEMFAGMEAADRKKVFTALFNFAMGVEFSYATVACRKSELGARDPAELPARLQARITRDLGLFIDERLAYFQGFDRVIVYYDNGQAAVNAAVRAAFSGRLFNVEFRRVLPSDYRLFQVADLVCTLELLRLKDASGRLTKSDLGFFGSPGKLRRNYLRHIARKRLG